MKEKEFKNVRWGDIYYCDLGVTNGSVQSGMRPVLVVQTNRLNESSPTVVVAAITAVKKKTALNTHIELNTDCGLKEPSMVRGRVKGAYTRVGDSDEPMTEYRCR